MDYTLVKAQVNKLSMDSIDILFQSKIFLTLKAPFMTAADAIHKYFFIVFQRK